MKSLRPQQRSRHPRAAPDHGWALCCDLCHVGLCLLVCRQEAGDAALYWNVSLQSAEMQAQASGLQGYLGMQKELQVSGLCVASRSIKDRLCCQLQGAEQRA